MQKSPDMLFAAPRPLLAGRLMFDLDPASGLSKTVKNFTGLCTGEKGMCKNAGNKKLHYLGCPMHRIVKGFVAQGGDITRGDGSGGEVRSSLGPWQERSVNAPTSQYMEANSTTTRLDSKPSSKRGPWRWRTRARTPTHLSSFLFSPTTRRNWPSLMGNTCSLARSGKGGRY